MRSKLIPLLLILVVGVIFWSLRETRSPTPHADGVSLDVGRLTAVEVNRQARSALDEMMNSEQPDQIRKAAALLKSLLKAPVLNKADAAQRQALLSQLELGRLTWVSQHQSLVQERDKLIAAMHQGDMAMEMLVAPMAGTDPYLSGVYDQYKRYSETLGLVSKGLFAAQNVAEMQHALVRMQGMAATVQDNASVLALEVATLREHAQVKAGAEALTQLIKPDQGCAARWVLLQQQQNQLASLALQLTDLFQTRA